MTETRWGATLRRAIAKRKRHVYEVAESVGISRQHLFNLISGDRTPTMEVVSRLADDLDAPWLVAVIKRERSGKCDECGGVFIRLPRAPLRQRFCGTRCRSNWTKREMRRRRAVEGQSRLKVSVQRELAMSKRLAETRQELAMWQADLERFCRDCSGTVCRTPDCEWYSRTPLVKEAAA